MNAGVRSARAEAVDKDVDLDAAPRRLEQRRMQLKADLVLEHDEGLEEDLVLGRAMASKTAGK